MYLDLEAEVDTRYLGTLVRHAGGAGALGGAKLAGAQCADPPILRWR